jgi:putative ABC transport system permease protein
MLRLAWRQLRREFAHGEARVLLIALVLAVASVGSVGLFADRVRQALTNQANVLLGADVLISGDRPLPPSFDAEAKRLGMSTTTSIRFGSMVSKATPDGQTVADASPVLTDVKAVKAGYPLRGAVRVNDGAGGEIAVSGIPGAGEVWIDERLAQRVQAQMGERVQVGATPLVVSKIFKEEPEVAGSFLTMSPKLLLNDADLAATQLLQPGTRASWRVHVAGANPATYETWAKAQLGAGQRLDTVRELRPEVRSTLDRAEQFLGLAALLAVILSAVAVALAVRSFLKRELNAAALMRCLGASRAKVWTLFSTQALILGAVGAVLGLVGAYAGQGALGLAMQYVSQLPLPWPGVGPALRAVGVGFVLILGFAMPPLFALANVPPLKVLRRDLGTGNALSWISGAAAAVALVALAAWQAGDVKIGTTVLGGTLALLLVSALVSATVIALVSRFFARFSPALRLGLANLKRRKLATGLQLACLSLGVMALLLLTQVAGDLFDSWRTSMPASAPNRFLINVLPDQVKPLQATLSKENGGAPEFFPMIRARLVAINGQSVKAADLSDERAKRLVDREFNLSMNATLMAGNTLTSGRWFLPDQKDELSLEDGIAKTLKVSLGDTLTFDSAGTSVTLRVSSLRKVEWDSFRVNFFAVSPPGSLDAFATTYITAFRAPDKAEALNAAIAQTAPNALSIDISEIANKVREIVGQVAKALEFVMLFAVAAGLLVLYAAVATTQDERRFDTAVLRVLGAARAQVRQAAALEFLVLGALAGLLGALGATLIGWGIAERALNVPYIFNVRIWLYGPLGAMLGVMIAGWLGVRRTLDASPLQTIRAAA